MRTVLLEFVRKATGQVGCKLQHLPRRGCRGIIAHDSKEGIAAGMNQKKNWKSEKQRKPRVSEKAWLGIWSVFKTEMKKRKWKDMPRAGPQI